MAALGGVLLQGKVSRMMSRVDGKPVLKPNRPLVLKDTVANRKPKKGGEERDLKKVKGQQRSKTVYAATGGHHITSPTAWDTTRFNVNTPHNAYGAFHSVVVVVVSVIVAVVLSVVVVL